MDFHVTPNEPDAHEPDALNEEQAQRITAFWEESRSSSRIADAQSVVGLGWAASIPPEAWAFGDNPDLADDLLSLVLAGTKTATATALCEFAEGDPLPKKDDLSIILDGAGEPKALIRTTDVTVTPFIEVDAEFAYLEGEDDRTLESWRTEHEGYWRRTLPPLGMEFSATMPVVCERFELVYPKP
ncbi:MAG: ASCH domain-containing protein [Cellulomonadaceae bacterium]|jgi:uncharacterized protein YhfF|nr:ASCH domain-containing protein [Cellulomonadaceae bacterium]